MVGVKAIRDLAPNPYGLPAFSGDYYATCGTVPPMRQNRQPFKQPLHAKGNLQIVCENIDGKSQRCGNDQDNIDSDIAAGEGAFALPRMRGEIQ
jgi:hypothetical protein